MILYAPVAERVANYPHPYLSCREITAAQSMTLSELPLDCAAVATICFIPQYGMLCPPERLKQNLHYK